MSIIPKLKPVLQKLEHYLRGCKLDYKNFEVIDIIPQDSEFAVTVMHNRKPGSYKPWCVQFKGNGRYFFSRSELDNYCKSRRFRGWR